MRNPGDRKDAVDTLLKDAMRRELPCEVEARLQGQLREFRGRLASGGRRGSVTSRLAHTAYRLGWATALLVIAVGIGTYLVGGKATPTWADVMKRFASVPFLHATIYVRDNAMSETAQLEVWMGQRGKVRLRAGGKVAFGEGGRLIEEVPISSPFTMPRELLIAEQAVQQYIQKLGRVDAFSFETLLRLLPELGTLSAPLQNQHATISNDLVVFDIASQDSPEWVRIWALRESRLPVRVLFWDPRSAQSTDVILSYGNQQSPDFFDPEAFKASLAAGGTNAADRAYALMRDVGGRPITPRDAEALRKAREEKEPDEAQTATGQNHPKENES